MAKKKPRARRSRRRPEVSVETAELSLEEILEEYRSRGKEASEETPEYTADTAAEDAPGDERVEGLEQAAAVERRRERLAADNEPRARRERTREVGLLVGDPEAVEGRLGEPFRIVEQEPLGRRAALRGRADGAHGEGVGLRRRAAAVVEGRAERAAVGALG